MISISQIMVDTKRIPANSCTCALHPVGTKLASLLVTITPSHFLNNISRLEYINGMN